MSVKDDLLAVPEREHGGQTAYDRFDFQTAWGVSRLIDLHAAGTNYAIAFEFHDDVVMLDDADAPSQAIFYQVKTKSSGNWSFAQITSRKKVKEQLKASYAGKMYDNFVKFGANVEKLAFVSNQPFPEVLVVHGEEKFSKAKQKELKKFISKMSLEIPEFKDPDHTSLFFFVFSELNLTNYDQAILGKIANFLEEEIGDHIPPKPFALTLNEMCRRKSKRLANFKSFEELKGSKFITRAEILKWLTQAKDLHEQRPEWSSVASDVSGSLLEKTMLERGWRAYEIELRSRPNSAALAITERIAIIVDAELVTASDLNDLLSRTFNTVRSLILDWKADASDAFIKAAILYELKR